VATNGKVRGEIGVTYEYQLEYVSPAQDRTPLYRNPTVMSSQRKVAEKGQDRIPVDASAMKLAQRHMTSIKRGVWGWFVRVRTAAA